MNEKAEIEQLKEQEDIKTALKQTTGTKEAAVKPVAKMEDKLWFGTYILVLLALGALYYFLASDFFAPETKYISVLQQLTIGGILVVLVLAIAKSIRVYWINQVDNRPARYNLTRVLNLVMVLAILIIGLSLLSANWYTALVSLGLLSLILGFALQTPITSLIGWVYLLIRQPYRVGDRIQIGEDAKGDVIDVSYLDTTLWEFGGELLSTSNHPSGRIIKFPNSKVLSSVVHNYSWSLFPYVWNDIKFQIAYQSDLEFVATVMREEAEKEVGDAMLKRIGVYRELLSKTPVDQIEVKERPVVVFRVAENTWIEAIVRYLVEPRLSGTVKSRLIKRMLERLNEEPDKVMFPKGNSR